MNKTQNFKSAKFELTAILDEMLVLQKFMDSFPKGRGYKKTWSEGVVFGIKYATHHLAEKLSNPKTRQAYDQLLGWQEEEQKLLGKKVLPNFAKLRN